MSNQETPSKDNIPGPKQPPRIHGEGCTCGDFARYGCPAAATYRPTAPQEALTKEEQLSDIRARVASAGSLGRGWHAIDVNDCRYLLGEIASLTARCRQLESALQAIVVFGHGEGHGRGFTCANMAQRAIDAALSQGAKA